MMVERTLVSFFLNRGKGHTMMNASIRNSLLSNNQTDTRLCCIQVSESCASV